MNEVTIDSLTEWLTNAVRDRLPISTGDWLDHASRINALLPTLTDELREASMVLNRMKAELVEAGKSAAIAKILCEASPAYERKLKLDAKFDRAVETIRLAKKRVEVPAWEH